MIVVDFQNDFYAPRRAFCKYGAPTDAYDAAVERANVVISAAAGAGALVVVVRNLSLPDLRTDSPAQLRMAWRARPSALRDSREPFR